MKRLLNISIFVVIAHCLSAQTLTLDSCQSLARSNYPLIRQKELIKKSEQYTLANINKIYLPQLTLNGQASYQSDVTEVNIKLKDGAISQSMLEQVGIPIDLASFDMNSLVDMPKLSKDQYRATLDLTQIIWDGGNIPAQKNLVKATGAMQQQTLEVSLYSITEKVNQIYFGILAIDEQLKLLEVVQQDLDNGMTIARSLLRNGVATQSDVDLVEVELLNLKQKRIEAQSLRKAFVAMLSQFTGLDFAGDCRLEKPKSKKMTDSELHRPELLLLDRQRDMYRAQAATVDAKILPTLGLFIEGGYGKPGLNMLSDRWKFYAIGGIKLQWNIGAFYTKSDEKKNIDNSLRLLDVQEDAFRFNTSMQLTQQQSETDKYRELITNDEEIIALRSRVKTASESKYRNGVYTTNDLLRDINAENQARQMRALHEIQYLQSIEQYKFIKGK